MFKAFVYDILQVLPILGESGSEVSYFIPEPRNFAEVTRLSDEIKKPWLKSTQNGIKNIINNQTFLVKNPDGGGCDSMHGYYKDKIQSYGSIDKLKLGIVVRLYLKNKELVGDTWLPTSSMRTLKYFLVDAVKHKARLHQLDFLGELLQAKVNNRVFVKLDSSAVYQVAFILLG